MYDDWMKKTPVTDPITRRETCKHGHNCEHCWERDSCLNPKS